MDRAKSGDYDHARSVFLGNLPMDAGEDEASADGREGIVKRKGDGSGGSSCSDSKKHVSD